MHLFPVDVNRCSYEMLLRVPGIGVKSAQRIRVARRSGQLDLADLKRIGVVLKRAQYFITCKGFSRGVTAGPEATTRGHLHESEIAQVRAFAALPSALTYPTIQPVLHACAEKYLRGGALENAPLFRAPVRKGERP